MTALVGQASAGFSPARHRLPHRERRDDDRVFRCTAICRLFNRNAGRNPRETPWIDRRGGVQAFGWKPGLYQSPRFSPDGHKLALTIRLPSPQIWIYDLDRGTLRQMTFAPGENELPVWAPDRLALDHAIADVHQALPPRFVIAR